MQDPFPEVELSPASLARPIVSPQLLSPTRTSREPSLLNSPNSCYDKAPASLKSDLSTEIRSKHESYDFTGSTFLITNTGRTLKLPVPSDSEHDPLNWSRWKTARAMTAISLFSVVCLTAAQAASVMLADIEAEFQDQHIAPWLFKALVSAPSLFMGVGCFFWVPLSIGLGRRPTLLLATVLVLLAMIGAQFSANFYELVAAVCFLGLGEGLSLSLVLLIIIDMTFINQRARAVALMWSVAGCLGTSGVALVPVIADHGRDWRLFYHYWTIAVLASLLVSFFFLPETYFKRPTIAFDGMIILQSATEKLTVYHDSEANSDLYRDLPEHPARSGFAGLRDRLGLSRSPFASWPASGRCFIQMGYCAANPLIFWVFVFSGANTASMIFIGATYTRVLLAPPYNISPDIVGTVNVASGVGALFSFLVWNFIICRIVTEMSRRNRGILEAEHYLIGYIVPVIVGAISSLLYGLSIHYKLPAPFIYLSYGLNGFSFDSLMIANTLWVAEAFPRWAAPALAVVGGGCYLLSFAMSFALFPWIEAHGFEWVGVELSALQLVGGLVAIPVAFWGKTARQAIQGRWAEDRSGALRPI